MEQNEIDLLVKRLTPTGVAIHGEWALEALLRDQIPAPRAWVALPGDGDADDALATVYVLSEAIVYRIQASGKRRPEHRDNPPAESDCEMHRVDVLDPPSA
jgi:hypothetical protein